jgi:hypothetical protein
MKLRCAIRSVAVATTVATGALFLMPVVASAAPAGTVSEAGARQAPLTPAEAKALSTHVTDRVIVVLRNRLSSTSLAPDATRARATAAADAQRTVLGELAQTHAKAVHGLQLLDDIVATVSPGEAARLRHNPAVVQVVTDRAIPLVGSLPSVKSDSSAAAAGIKPLSGACTTGTKVQLDPEAIENIHAASQSGKGDVAQALGYTGAGVKVAYIADGIDIDNPDFIRADGQHVFVDYQDFSGTGTGAQQSGGEAYIDASSIAAQGRHVYNVQGYGVGLDRKCDIRILGVAPGASLVGLNVFGSAEFAFNSVFLEAINYAVEHDHVNVLNESFGSNPFPDLANLDLTRAADDAAVKAGVTVTVSTGDAGVGDTIGSPATDPLLLSAGASTTYRAYAQTGIGGITYPKVTGWDDNNISDLSSSGVTEDGHTVDVVAPGDLNFTLCSANPQYADCTNFAGQPASVQLSGGTSEAAPLTAGVAALVIQAYAKAHGGKDPSPAVVKQIITSTAENISAPGDQQGAGLDDAYLAVLAAKSYKTTTTAPAPSGHALILGSSQLSAAAAPGTTESLSDTVTNEGSSAVKVYLSSRVLGAYTSVKTASVTLADQTGDSAVVHFTVPAGQARLNGAIAYKSPGDSSEDFDGIVNLSLIAPDGHLALYDLPQGDGNYGDAQVRRPAAGTWTALISGAPSADGGTTGTVRFGASVAPWTTFGTVSTPSLTLAAGATRSFGLTVATPAGAGDEVGSVVVATNAAEPSFARVTTVPVVLRSYVPTPDPTSTFTGTLTGGNGRDTVTGETAYYQVTVPASTPALSADIKVANPADTFLAELVSPTGQAASAGSNALLSNTDQGQRLTAEDGTQLHVLAPVAGTWTLVLDFFNQVSGTALSQPYTVSLGVAPASAQTSPALPDSASTSLPQGTADTVEVHVTNTGTSPEEYFTDARLATSKTMRLVSQTSPEITLPATGTFAVPTYLVPSQTTSITASASARKDLLFDYSYNFGDPDLISDSLAATHNTGTYIPTSGQVSAGDWSISPFLTGPDGVKGYKPVNVRATMTAVARAFDRTVRSPTGDLWQDSVNTSVGVTPYVVQPGQSATIPVTITPTGAVGITVQGTLYVDDLSPVDGDATSNEFSGIFPEGSDVAAFAYEYKVGPAAP